MIATFKIWPPRIAGLFFTVCVLIIEPRSGAVAAEAYRDQVNISHQVVGLKLSGLERTDPQWLKDYIGYQFPCLLGESDLSQLKQKLLTTSLFTEVEVNLVPAEPTKGSEVLRVSVRERWTLIPVIRGAYGGGTPLRVLGLYDINAFGRYLTLGGESRQHGSAKPGFVLYGRNPRGDSDRYYLGEEIWRDFRRRQIFDRYGHQVGDLSADMAMNRLRVLLPVGEHEGGHRHYWKLGGELEVMREGLSSYAPLAASAKNVAAPDNLYLNDAPRTIIRALPVLMYDDIDIDHLNYDGFRLRLRGGPVLAGTTSAGFAEVDGYYYKLIGPFLNVAAHGLLGRSTLRSVQAQSFLGGLDTLRGLPDGAIYGTHVGYSNLELRYLGLKSDYLWVQTAAFLDAGEAGTDWSDAGANSRVTSGVGLRFSVPQIYRLIVRVDYAWSVVGPKTRGVTIGMNQFFDPFTPL